MMRSLLIGAAALITSTGAAFAGEQFVDRKGVANFGYDVVAYHTVRTATEGTDAFSAEYNGATFWFASAENRDLFVGDPARYAPGYDGHCAFALTSYKKLTVDPEAFVVVDPATNAPVAEDYDPSTDAGVLYLNYSPSVNEQFREDISGNLKKADFAWIDCLETQPAANPRKNVFRDLGSRNRPDFCPSA